MATVDQIREYANKQGFKPNATTGAYDVADDAMAARIYGHARDQGFTSSELDTALNWKAGTADGWITKNNMPGLKGPAPTPPTPGPAPLPPDTRGEDPAAGPGGVMRASVTNGAPSPVNVLGQMDAIYAAANKSLPQIPVSKIADPTPVQAETKEVPYEHTTAGIIGNLLKEDGDYLKRARAISREEMNDRGLLSSSVAAGAAVGAAIDRAGAIASTDAGIYANQRLANMNATNEMRNANANRSFAAAQANAGAENDASMARFSATANLGSQVVGSQLKMSEMEFENQLQKGTLGLQAFLDMKKMGYGSDLNIREAGYAVGLDLMKMAKANDYDIEKMAKANGYTLDQMSAAFGLDVKKMQIGQDYDLSKLAKSNDYDINRMALDFGYRTQLQEAASRLDASVRKDLVGYEAQLSNSLTGRGALANLSVKYADMFDVIRRDPDLSPEDKERAMNDLRNDFKSNASVIAGLYGLDATEYISKIGINSSGAYSGSSSGSGQGALSPVWESPGGGTSGDAGN